MAKLERAELTRQRTGREPLQRTRYCSSEKVEVIPLLQVRDDPSAGMTPPAELPSLPVWSFTQNPCEIVLACSWRIVQ